MNYTIELFEKLIDTSLVLSERQKIALKARLWGKSFEQIGKDFGVTRERIRQIEHKAGRILIQEIKNLNSFKEKLRQFRSLLKQVKQEIEEIEIGGKSCDSENEIELLALSRRIMNSLLKFGFKTIVEIQNTSDEELMKVKMIGPRCVQYIRRAIERYEKENSKSDNCKCGEPLPIPKLEHGKLVIICFKCRATYST